MAYQLKELSVEFISLVKSPANRKGLVLKGRDARTFEIKKTDAKLKRAYGVVYAPDEEDAQGDSADAETIRKAADEFMKDGRLKNVDSDHDFVPKGAFVAESWIVRKGDPTFSGESEGAWAVGIQITDDALWKGLESGEYTGISLAGNGRRVKKEDDEPPGWFRRFLAKAGRKADDGETGEDVEKMEDEMKEQFDEIKAAIAELKAALAKRPEGEEEPEEEGVQKSGETVAALAKQVEELKAEVSKARTDAADEMKKLLAEALAKGRGETAGPGQSVESEMV
jgi:hypothetical protein